MPPIDRKHAQRDGERLQARRTNRFRAPCLAFTLGLTMTRLLYGENRACPHRLLFIYAHPDDESFGVAGIARMYADQGAEIALVTATRGDAGRAGEPPLCSRADLPARREAELREAARILGIGHVTVLDYLDKHLAEAPSEKIRRELVERDSAPSSAGRRHVRSGRRESASRPHRDFAVRESMRSPRPAIRDGTRTPASAHRVQRLLWTRR